MTRTDILSALADRLNKTLPPNMDSATQARLIRFMNQRQRRYLTMPGLKHLREDTIPLSTVASQVTYALPNIAKIERIFDPVNMRTLYEMSKQDWRLVQPDTTITGIPEAFIWLGRGVVAQQPSDASSLFLKSTSAADTTQTAYVEGVITGNYPFSASVTLTGTTAVNLSAAVTAAIRVDKVYLSAACAGTVTLLEDSGAGTELARITIGQTMTDYCGLAFYLTPSGVIAYQVDITRAITDFSQATDVPVLPEDFHDLMILGPLADEYQHLEDKRWSVAMSEVTRRENELKYWLAETATGRPFTLSRAWQRPSQLGSWFPAGS